MRVKCKFSQGSNFLKSTCPVAFRTRALFRLTIPHNRPHTIRHLIHSEPGLRFNFDEEALAQYLSGPGPPQSGVSAGSQRRKSRSAPSEACMTVDAWSRRHPR